MVFFFPPPRVVDGEIDRALGRIKGCKAEDCNVGIKVSALKKKPFKLNLSNVYYGFKAENGLHISALTLIHLGALGAAWVQLGASGCTLPNVSSHGWPLWSEMDWFIPENKHSPGHL